MFFSKAIAVGAIAVLTSISTPASANICGIGKVVEVREGGWDLEDLLIKLEYTVQQEHLSHVGTRFEESWIRYQAASLTPERLRAIRALAYLAIATGKSVYTWTHNSDGCTNATELSVYNEGETDPRTPNRTE